MFNNNQDYFPTPQRIIDKMLSGIDFKLISTVMNNTQNYILETNQLLALA